MASFLSTRPSCAVAATSAPKKVRYQVDRAELCRFPLEAKCSSFYCCASVAPDRRVLVYLEPHWRGRQHAIQARTSQRGKEDASIAEARASKRRRSIKDGSLDAP